MVIGVIHEGVDRNLLAGARANLSPRYQSTAAIFPLAAQRQIHPTHLYSPPFKLPWRAGKAGALPGLEYAMLWDKFCVIRFGGLSVELFLLSGMLEHGSNSSVKFIVYQVY